MGRPSYFTARKDTWPNETVVIIGGGPSLKGFDLSPIRGRAKVITVNNAWELAPWTDVLFFADARWWRWNGPKLPADFGARVISVTKGHHDDARILRMRKEGNESGPITRDPNALYGRDSGLMAINLAFHFGAARVVLLGFDMQFQGAEAHWHPDHPVPSQERYYRDMFAPTYEPALTAMAAEGMEVVRCTPSALTFIPQLTLEDALALPRGHRIDLNV